MKLQGGMQNMTNTDISKYGTNIQVEKLKGTGGTVVVLEKMDVLLKGIEVGVKAEDEKFCLSTGRFHLVVNDLDLLGKPSTPQACIVQVVFNGLQAKFLGDRRDPRHISALARRVKIEEWPKTTVMHARTNISISNKLQVNSGSEDVDESAHKLCVTISSTNITVHPTFLEHLERFTRHFTDAYTEELAVHTPDFSFLQQKILPDGVEFIQDRGTKAFAAVEEDVRKKGSSAYMQVFVQDLCVCMAFDYTGSTTAYFKSRHGKNVAALLLMFQNTAIAAKVGFGLGLGLHLGLGSSYCSC